MLPPLMTPTVWQTARHAIRLDQPRVMGIVNLTPDSFSDGGRYTGIDAGRALCDRLLAEGADILDLGGESTRPGAQMPSVNEELGRVMPVLAHAVTLGVPVSVDCSRPELIAAVLAAGADIINDVRALQWPGALDAAACSPSAGLCLMHMQGQPATMQRQPAYGDVVGEVMTFLGQRVQAVTAAGIAKDRLVVDPGYGFGKTQAHNLTLWRRQRELQALGLPLLVGWSRKGGLGQITGRGVDDRLVASVAAALASVVRGASLVRVHDVAATVDALRVWQAAGLLSDGQDNFPATTVTAQANP